MIALHIAFDFQEGPWGGGNQFLKALREELRRRSSYSEEVGDADVVLLNSHHSLEVAAEYLGMDGAPRIIHRLDGPVDLIRGYNGGWDAYIHRFAMDFADGVVYQSTWSRVQNLLKCPALANVQSTVVPNAPPPGIFFSAPERPAAPRTRLITTSWSSNPRKGFDVLEYIDKTIDETRYEMTFIGNSTIDFARIRHVPPLGREGLAEELRAHDIFIAPSRDDPCSNALLEALHCGLPVAYRNSGGHGELVQGRGAPFHAAGEVWRAVAAAGSLAETPVAGSQLPNLSEVAEQYVLFAERILDSPRRHPRPGLTSYLKLRGSRLRASVLTSFGKRR